MTGILAAIDATIGGQCVCGCGVTLDPAGPSAWWATEACQARWQRGDTGLTPTEWPAEWLAAWDFDPAEFIAAARRLADAFAQIGHSIVESMRCLDPPAPADPMARALELRRNRHTGPKVPPRAPRRIDPRRAR